MAVATARPRRGMSKAQRHKQLVGLLFISPWLFGFLLWTLYPLVSSMYYSLHRYDLMRPPVFIGLQNYIEIFVEDVLFPKVVYNTLYFVGLGIPLGVAVTFLLANLLNTKIRGRSGFRAIFFFPAIIPAFVTAMVWQFLLNVQYGAINGTLIGLGLPAIPFIANPALAKPSLILIHIWAQGSVIVIFLASPESM